MDTVDRIFEILDRLPMEQREFAKLVGVSDDTASDWRRRRSASYTKRLANSLTPEGQKEVIAFIEFKRGQESQS